jgi:hypothetical protein
MYGHWFFAFVKDGWNLFDVFTVSVGECCVFMCASERARACGEGLLKSD